MTFGINKDAEIRASDLYFEKNHSTFELSIYGKSHGKVTVHVPGKHNVQNAESSDSSCE